MQVGETMAQINITTNGLPLSGGTLTGNLNMASGANVTFSLSGVNSIGALASPLGQIFVD